MARLAHVLAVGVAALACAVPVALADGPPPPTTTSTSTTPQAAPDPAPPNPVHTSKPKPAPTAVTHSRPAPASTPAPPRPVLQVQNAGPARTQVHRPQAKKQRKTPANRRTVPPQVNIRRSLTPLGITGVPATATKSGAAVFILIVSTLAAAILCFGVVSIPATLVAHRAAGDFVVRHKLDMTLFGAALLVTATFTLLWSSKP